MAPELPCPQLAATQPPPESKPHPQLQPRDLDLRDAAIRCLTDVRVAQRTEPGARDAALWSMGQATRAMARAGCVFLAPDLSRRGRRDPRPIAAKLEDTAREYGVPVVYALTRRDLGRAFLAGAPDVYAETGVAKLGAEISAVAIVRVPPAVAADLADLIRRCDEAGAVDAGMYRLALRRGLEDRARERVLARLQALLALAQMQAQAQAALVHEAHYDPEPEAQARVALVPVSEYVPKAHYQPVSEPETPCEPETPYEPVPEPVPEAAPEPLYMPRPTNLAAPVHALVARLNAIAV